MSGYIRDVSFPSAVICTPRPHRPDSRAQIWSARATAPNMSFRGCYSRIRSASGGRHSLYTLVEMIICIALHVVLVVVHVVLAIVESRHWEHRVTVETGHPADRMALIITVLSQAIGTVRCESRAYAVRAH